MALLLKVFERFARSMCDVPAWRFEAGVEYNVYSRWLTCACIFDGVAQEVDDLSHARSD